MFIRSFVPAILGALIAGAAAMPSQAQDQTQDQTQPMLGLNAVQAAPAGQRATWRLTLEFGRADRSTAATARSVRAPALVAHDIMITTADGIAAPFIIREVSAPAGNAITLLIEYFGPEPLVSSDQFVVSVLEDDRVDTDRASAEFDFLPPALDAAGG